MAPGRPFLALSFRPDHSGTDVKDRTTAAEEESEAKFLSRRQTFSLSEEEEEEKEDIWENFLLAEQE
jgi:hypothetical protein